MEGIGNKVNNFGEWVYRLLLLNMLWMFFAILGLGIFGVFPATAALFSVLRKFFTKKRDVKLVKDFWSFYRKDFWRSNAVGYTIVAIASILWLDFRYFMSVTDFGMFVLAHFMLLFFVFSLLSLCVLFPIFSHYKLTFWQYIKNALLYPWTHLGTMILFTASIVLYSYIVYQIPGFLPFIGISFPCFLLMKLLFPTFQANPQKAKKSWFKKQKEETLYY